MIATVVDTATSKDVSLDPYPHLVIHNALPGDYYSALSDAYPVLDDLPRGRADTNNKRIDLLSSWGPAALPQERLPNIWKTFIAEHSAPTFCRKVFDLFSSCTVPGTNPGMRAIKMEAFGESLVDRLGIEGPVTESDIVGRATLAANTPVKVATSVRGAHVDSPRKAFVGLYYLRHPNDDSEGGDLSIHRVKAGCKVDPWAANVDPETIEEVRVIRYAPNTLVLMLNTHYALHGVHRAKAHAAHAPASCRLRLVSGRGSRSVRGRWPRSIEVAQTDAVDLNIFFVF